MSDPAEFSLKDIERRMDGALNTLRTEFQGLRTGRASASLVEPVMVEAYGSQMPLSQVGTISVPEPRMISIQIWDKGMVGAAEKAIRNAGLGVNPVVDGQLIRVPIPELNEERRKELVKLAGKYAEQAKVAVRNVRRDGMEKLKRAEKEGQLSQDEHTAEAERVQEATDRHIKLIEEAVATKEEEILQV